MDMNNIKGTRATQSPQEKDLPTYMVDGKRFVVTPVFNESRGESFAAILFRLLQAEIAAQ